MLIIQLFIYYKPTQLYLLLEDIRILLPLSILWRFLPTIYVSTHLVNLSLVASVWKRSDHHAGMNLKTVYIKHVQFLKQPILQKSHVSGRLFYNE